MRAFGFYSSMELTSISWQRGSFFVGKILISMRILQDPFLVIILLIRVNHGAQDISLYTHIRGGQVRPRWTRQRPLSFRQLPCRLTKMSSSVKMELSTYDIVAFISLNAQLDLTGSLGPLASSYTDEFILLPKLLLSVVPYSIAPSALADKLWSLICIFSVIFIRSEKRVFINGSLSSYH